MDLRDVSIINQNHLTVKSTSVCHHPLCSSNFMRWQFAMCLYCHRNPPVLSNYQRLTQCTLYNPRWTFSSKLYYQIYTTINNEFSSKLYYILNISNTTVKSSYRYEVSGIKWLKFSLLLAYVTYRCPFGIKSKACYTFGISVHVLSNRMRCCATDRISLGSRHIHMYLYITQVYNGGCISDPAWPDILVERSHTDRYIHTISLYSVQSLLINQ